jgi:hypothetical protein
MRIIIVLNSTNCKDRTESRIRISDQASLLCHRTIFPSVQLSLDAEIICQNDVISDFRNNFRDHRWLSNNFQDNTWHSDNFQDHRGHSEQLSGSQMACGTISGSQVAFGTILRITGGIWNNF